MASVSDILETMEYGPSPESNTIVKDWLKTHEAGFGALEKLYKIIKNLKNTFVFS